MISLPVSDFELDLIMACRYSYYCLARSLVPDEHYDRLEREYRLIHGDVLPVGSESKDSYTPAQRALALYFNLSGHSVGPSNYALL